jgi:hypothetical protein
MRTDAARRRRQPAEPADEMAHQHHGDRDVGRGVGVGERMRRIGRVPAAPDRDGERHLVAGVGHRVQRLGQQRRRAGSMPAPWPWRSRSPCWDGRREDAARALVGRSRRCHGRAYPCRGAPIPAAADPLQRYGNRGFMERSWCQSASAASRASCTRSHASPSRNSRRKRTCPRSSALGVSRPSCLAMAVSRASARSPGRVTCTMIAVSGTSVDRTGRDLSPGARVDARVNGPLHHRFAARCGRGARCRPVTGLRSRA